MDKIAPWQFDEYVRAEADGHITPDQLAAIEADPVAWRARRCSSCSATRRKVCNTHAH